MKTLIVSVILTLISQTVLADLGDRAAAAGYGRPEDIEPTICDEVHNFDEVKGPCDAIAARMNSGHLVKEADYNAWCGMAHKYKAKAEQYAADYKKVYGKKFEYSRCRK